MTYLLDTNVVSDIVQGNVGHRGEVAKRFLRVPQKEIAISVLTVYELRHGLLNLSKTRFSAEQKEYLEKTTEQVIQACEVLPFSVLDAERAAVIQRWSQDHGRQMGGIDACIAGQAVNRRMILVSHDRAAFGVFPEDVLRWEDWFE